MRLTLPGRKRLIRLLIGIVVALILVVYVALPVAFGFIATRPQPSAVGAPPEGFTAVTLTSDDGVTLAGWYAPPHNGAAILLLHGAGNSREGVRAHAALLVEHGFGVLAFDQRGHGASGGQANQFGWQGTHDLGAALAFLQAQDEVQAIGALGLSLGGEILLGAASAYPEVRAIASEGATHRSFADLYTLPSEQPFYRHFVSRVVYLAAQVFSGEAPPPVTMLESMQAAEATQFLLMAGGAMEAEVAYNSYFAEQVGERAALWVIPEAGHIQGLALSAQTYAAQVIGFFEAVLLPA